MSGPDKTPEALRRLLANGPLTGMPVRPQDQALLARLAAARFEAGRAYREGEVNETLTAWLATFCAPFGIDHVTLRRLLVDSRYLVRDPAGASYRVDPQRLGPPELIDLAQLWRACARNARRGASGMPADSRKLADCDARRR